jgi:hypothetical protein
MALAVQDESRFQEVRGQRLGDSLAAGDDHGRDNREPGYAATASGV